jgi:hypothetical protein
LWPEIDRLVSEATRTAPATTVAAIYWQSKMDLCKYRTVGATETTPAISPLDPVFSFLLFSIVHHFDL